MIILDATTKSLEIVLASAITTNQLPFVASYVDITANSFSAISADGASNSTSGVTVVAAPAATIQRQLKYFNINNIDTVAATVTVRLNDNSTLRILMKVILQVGDALIYVDGVGWSVVDANGQLKGVGIQGKSAGFCYTFKTATSGDPLAGGILVDNALLAAAANININAVTAAGQTISNFILTWDDSTNSNKTVLLIYNPLVPSDFVMYYVTGGITTSSSGGSTYYIVPVTSIANGVTAFTASEALNVLAFQIGDKGGTGATGATGATGPTGPTGPSNLPQNSKSAAYTTVLGDAGGHIFHPTADVTARTWTIDSNANVPYIIGTTITFVNQNGAGVITIAITSDTMRLAGPGTTGSRTLAANGIATALKVTATEWIISGSGLT